MLRYDVQFNSIERLDHFDRLAHQEHKLCRVPIIATENYIADSLPPSLQPSSCELIAWYYGNGSFCSEASYELSPDSANVWNPYVEKFIYEPRRVCNKELRSALGLAGEPDIAGIGVMISYCIEVLLVTMCLALIVTEKLMQNRPNGKLKSLFSAPITVRLLNAFRGSIQALFSSAMIFSFAMVLATLTTFMYRLDRIEVENRWMNGEDVSLYEPQLLVTASTFSMFPVVVLQFTMQSQLSGMRRRARAALLVIFRNPRFGWYRRAAAYAVASSGQLASGATLVEDSAPLHGPLAVFDAYVLLPYDVGLNNFAILSARRSNQGFRHGFNIRVDCRANSSISQLGTGDGGIYILILLCTCIRKGGER
ncbi:hypothetical protein TruAng_002017 [Truncatella angustata]|nr:hypothetical protein TruAng_002017 [Truncatella angustata]